MDHSNRRNLAVHQYASRRPSLLSRCGAGSVEHYSLLLPAALALAHLALAARDRALFAAGDILRLPAVAGLAGEAPRNFAHLALAAAAMAARPAALILRPPFLRPFPVVARGTEGAGVSPSISVSSFRKASILSLRSAACRNCLAVRFRTSIVRGVWCKTGRCQAVSAVFR